MGLPSVIVFLGNPGREYAKTRHNAGFQMAEHWFPAATALWQRKFQGEWASVRISERPVHLFKPLTFMNLSGDGVRALIHFYRLPVEDLIVIHDDVELPFGEVRGQCGGGLAGHNGLKSIAKTLDSREFGRIRLGIGRPEQGDVASFVLGRFSPDEEIDLLRIFREAESVLDLALAGKER